MPDPTSSPASNHAQPGQRDGSLAAMLEPHLAIACDNRLSRVEWFHSEWQAGGAATGLATFELPGGTRTDAVVKVPVGPSEHRWTALLGGGESGGPSSHHAAPLCEYTPRVLACGTELGGYDLAWLVIERLDGTPRAASPSEHDVRGLLAAAAAFYAAAAKARPITEAEPPPLKDWEKLISKGREIIRNHGIAEEQRWNQAIHAVQRALPGILSRWRARPINTWCHGDLHFGNALRRRGSRPDEPCVLIDFALVHPGHWIEDAVYLERLYWAKPELLHGIKPVSELARLQREAGTLGQEDYSMLANIRRVLMAASVPAFLLHEGHPRYVHAALEVLEKFVPIVGR
ncbi:MAG TPA: phosphotransferase [Phycisphaerales bacterium]|nr:phosphotransferase [Phycisphaerales bacterium]